MLRFAREREPSPESRSTFLLLRDQLSLSSTVSTNALDLVFFSFFESFQRENCKSLVNSVFPVSSSRRVHKRFEGVFERIKEPDSTRKG